MSHISQVVPASYNRWQLLDANVMLPIVTYKLRQLSSRTVHFLYDMQHQIQAPGATLLTEHQPSPNRLKGTSGRPGPLVESLNED